MHFLGLAVAVSFLSATLVGTAIGGHPARKLVGSAGVVVSVLADWQSIPQRRYPRGSALVDPVTRIVTASGRITFGRGCNGLVYSFAPQAVAIVLVEWTGGTPGAVWKRRPAAFTERNLPVRKGLLECFSGRGGSAQFAERGRRFAAFVLAGRRASTASIGRARAVLDSLKVTRRP